MGDDEPGKKTKTAGRPLGPTGDAVRENIRRIRDGQGMSQSELSKKLGQLGRPIPPLGIHRIENGDRRVDVDDLASFAVALGVSPAGLLMPGEFPNGARIDAVDPVSVTGYEKPVMAIDLWHWLTAASELRGEDVNLFIARSWPHWQRMAWNETLEGERKRILEASNRDRREHL